MRFLKNYFLPWLIILSVVFMWPLFLKNDTAGDDAYIVIPIMTLVTAMFCSTLLYLWNTKWGPAQQRKKMNKAPFTQFYDIGFKQQDGYAIGIIDNYHVIFRYNWSGSTGKPSVSFETLFNPKKGSKFIHQNQIDELNKIYKSEAIIWNRNYIFKEWAFNFKPPSFYKIEPFIQQSIEILKSEHIQPISLEESVVAHC